MELQGFRTVSGHDIPVVDTPKEMAAVPLDKEVGAVVVGMDSTFNYCKFSYAIRCVTYSVAEKISKDCRQFICIYPSIT